MIRWQRWWHDMQSRLQSWVEAIGNTALGFLISFGVLHAVAWFYDLPLNHQQNAEITAIFTVSSLLRSYGLRRFFNWLHGKQK